MYGFTTSILSTGNTKVPMGTSFSPPVDGGTGIYSSLLDKKEQECTHQTEELILLTGPRVTEWSLHS